jgi:lysozyme
VGVNLSKLAEELIDQEGYREHAYKDSLGYWTIGIGHFLGSDNKWASLNWFPKQIFVTFLADVAAAEQVARSLYPHFDSLSDARQRAVINMSFNMGYGTLVKFVNSNRLFNEGKFAEAADNFMKSKWAAQVEKRARYVTELIRNG